MPAPVALNLQEVRQKLLGYRLKAVADLTGISSARLEELERGDPPTVFEAEELSRVYGIDPDLLSEAPVRLASGDGVAILALQEEFRDLDDSTRLRIVAAANAARDLATLARKAGVTRADRLPKLSNPRPSLPPHRQGGKHAEEVRHQVLSKDSRDEPIESLRDFVAHRFAAITVLHARLGAYGPAGLSFSDSLRGPTIVLNPQPRRKKRESAGPKGELGA